MHDTETKEPWRELGRLAEEGTPDQIESYIEQMPAGEVALAMSRLSEREQGNVLTMLAPADAADLVEQLSDVQAAELIEHLNPQAAAAIVVELPSDEQADLLGDLSPGEAEAVLAAMAPEEAEDARRLTRYADDVAGGLMVTEYLSYPDHSSVADVVEDLRANADQYSDYDIQYVYICDTDRRLTGVLRLRDLLLAGQRRPIAEIMIRQPLSVRDNTSLDGLADLFDSYHFLGVPVADEIGHLVGVVQKSAVEEARRDRNESDFLKSQGIVGGEEIRTMPLMRRSRRRLAWLSANILLNIMAASVIALFQDTLSSVIALAVFLPIISDMSGCSGGQAVAVSMRELSLGLVRPEELWRVWLKEISVGLINGTVLGLLIGAVGWLWKGNPYLGLVVAFALCVNTMVAVSIGGTIPLIMKRLKMDPAIASGPILTTVTDMCGFFLVLGTATLLLPHLTG